MPEPEPPPRPPGPPPESIFVGLPPAPPPPSPQDEAQAERAAFALALRALTPRVVVTPALVAVNVVVFVLMLGSGVHPLTPAAEAFLPWGGNYGPLTIIKGEWWRLLTANFLHFGLIHLAVNMWVLWDVGPLVERLVGNVGFLLLYLLSGILGSVASLFWTQEVVSAGASGAVFGVFGALLGFLLWRRDSVPTDVLAALRNSGGAFLAYNFLFGLVLGQKLNIDHAAHLGGLAGGFLCGIVLSQPLTAEARRGRPLRNIVLAGVGAAVVAAGILLVPAKGSGLLLVMADFDRTQKNVLETYNNIVERAQRGAIPDPDFVAVLDRDVLPPWREIRARIDQLKGVSPEIRPRLDLLREYCRLREEHWTLIAEAVREGNRAKIAEAHKKVEQVEDVLKRLNALER